MEEGGSWGIGLVRRLQSPAEGITNVGIACLSRGVVKVDLSATADGTTFTLNALLLLSSEEGSAHKGEVLLILPSDTFSMDQTFTMRAIERTYSLVPRKLVESGEGYELSGFLVRYSET